MRWFAAIGRDLRQGFRALRGTPAFTVSVVLTLALGIGANTAAFSVVNALMFRPLPVRGADRLVVLATSRAPSRALGGLSYPEIQDYHTAVSASFEDVAGYTAGFAGLAANGGSPARVLVTWVTGSYFPLLGISPSGGRLIEERDVAPGRVSPIAVLGYESWRVRFNSDPSVVGRQVRVNGQPCTVVGIAPRGFTGTFAFADPELFLPLNWSSADVFSDRHARGLHTLARLRAAASLAETNAQLDVIAHRLEIEHPDSNTGVRVTAIPERLARPEEDNARSNGLAAAIILVLVLLVFVAAQVNVMNLLLARAGARRRELAIRVAVGAGRARLVQQLLTETALLAAAGGGAGLLLASWTTAALAAIRLPGSLPVHFDFHADARVLAYAFALTTATAATVGVLAALRASRVDVDAALRGSGASPRARRARLRTVLVVAQTAICFVLLVAAGMFTRSLREARQMDIGFDPRGILNVQMDAAEVGYDDDRGRALFEEIERRVRRIPAVEDVSYACTVPMGYVRLSTRVGPASAAEPDRTTAGMNIVGPRYFRVMRIPIVRGRSFDERDTRGNARVAIVNAQLARALWPGRDPIGRQFTDRAGGTPLEVVGVAETSKYRLLFEDPQPYFYVPLSQHDTVLRVLHVRTLSSPPESLAGDVERVIRELEPALPLYDVQSMSDALNGGPGFFLVRTAAVFAAILGGLAALLAIVGVYGVMSCAVTDRSREMGIRLALGATRGNIARIVVAEASMLVAAGVVLGAAGALAAARLISRVLFGVAPTDPVSFAAAAAGLALVAVVAAFLPAARAIATDPVKSLRTE